MEEKNQSQQPVVQQDNKKNKWIVPAIIIGLVVIIVILAIALGNNNSSSSDDSYDSGSSSNNSSEKNHQTTKEEKPKELTESEKMIVKISALIDEGLAYDTGSYIQGDITPGDYAFVKFDGSGSYYCEKDAAGNILDNENFDSFGYVKVHGAGNLETRGVLISITAFEKLEVSGAKEIYEILNNLKDYNQGGYYKVGVDIAPGSYVVESMGGSGYYAIMSGPVSNSNIIDNDNFSGRAAVNLKNGQYIEVSRSTINPKQ